MNSLQSAEVPLPFHSTRQSSNNFSNFAFQGQGEPPRNRGQLSQPLPQNASPPRRQPPVTTSTSPESARRPPTHAHRRSNSLTGMNQGVGNLNRWSKSTVSSTGSTQPAHKRSNSARRMSLSGSTTFLLGADNTSPPKKLQKNRPSTANSPQSQYTRSNFESSLTLPPIVTLPSLQTSVNNGSSPLAGPRTPSPSTAAILSAAVRTTVPDYFGKAWEESTPRAFAANADSPASLQTNGENNRRLVAEGEKPRRGHSRHRSQAGKSSNSTGSNRNSSKQPSQKAMLSKALQKANTAVLLDNAQNFEGAMQAYSEACALLQQVMIRSSGDEDRRKLEAIVNSPLPAKIEKSIIY